MLGGWLGVGVLGRVVGFGCWFFIWFQFLSYYLLDVGVLIFLFPRLKSLLLKFLKPCSVSKHVSKVQNNFKSIDQCFQSLKSCKK